MHAADMGDLGVHDLNKQVQQNKAFDQSIARNVEYVLYNFIVYYFSMIIYLNYTAT